MLLYGPVRVSQSWNPEPHRGVWNVDHPENLARAVDRTCHEWRNFKNFRLRMRNT